ncbi:MAG: hybrid sensor histidine kinase/response regulator [Thermodesulfovibrio sp.]|nr:hybrid sensor histidine kinase/response regulator [Thermodesulfovibrio sp.]
MENNVSRLRLMVQDIFTSGMHDKCEPADLYKFMMLNLCLILGTPFVLGFGLYDIYHGIQPLGYIITTIGFICATCFYLLRRTKNYNFFAYLVVFVIFWMFLYLLASGGSGNSGLLWFYSFPPIVLFLLGFRKGSLVVLTSLAASGFILFWPGTPFLSASYSSEIKLRFVPSIIVLWSITSLFEHIRAATLKIEIKNTELQGHIEELRQAEEARQESEDRYRILFDRAGEGIFTLSVGTKILNVNESLARMHGYSPQEMQNMDLLDLDTPETAKLIPERMTRLMAGEALTFEVEHYHKDGHAFPLEVSASLICFGNDAYIQCFHRDITERKQAEKALKASEEVYRNLSTQFNALLDAIPDNLFLMSPDLKMLWANKAAAAGVNKESEDIIGQHCYSLWHNINSPCDPCPALRSFSTSQPASDIVTTHDGKVFELRTLPVKQDETVVSVIKVARDITAQRSLEEQLRHSQKMESVGTLAGGIAHDFNNILSAIIGYSDIVLMKMETDHELRSKIEHIRAAADKAAYLTQGLLAFSRKQLSNKKQVDLNEQIKKAEYFFRTAISAEVRFRVNLHGQPILVFADPNQIEQVLMNLITNARDAMPAGGELIVTTEPYRIDEEFPLSHGYGNPGHYALISVSDSGSGMDEETRRRIFEPFFTTKEVGKGTGLGLSIIYGIIKQHDGFIEVDSNPGAGTTFRIYLPIVRTAPSETADSEKTSYPAGGSETILLAEDDEMLRKLAESVLREFGYNVIVAVDGDEAVEKFIQNQDCIDLLISDLVMPKKNGKEVHDAIRKIRPELKTVFVSGYSPEIVRSKISPGKDVTIMYKPVSPMDLLRKIRSVLDAGKP